MIAQRGDFSCFNLFQANINIKNRFREFNLSSNVLFSAFMLRTCIHAKFVKCLLHEIIIESGGYINYWNFKRNRAIS